MEKTLSIKMRKNGTIEFMKKHNITIPKPIPKKRVFLSLIGETNVRKQNVVYNIVRTSGCSVLRLPSYQCVLNPIEMVWNQKKQHCWRRNIYTNEP